MISLYFSPAALNLLLLRPKTKEKKTKLEWILSSTSCQFHQRSTRSFCAPRSQKCKKTVNLSVFIVLLGSGHVKASRIMLVKLTPDSCVLKSNPLLNASTAFQWSRDKKLQHSYPHFITQTHYSEQFSHNVLILFVPHPSHLAILILSSEPRGVAWGL
jgi:hypothetical protein